MKVTQLLLPLLLIGSWACTPTKPTGTQTGTPMPESTSSTVAQSSGDFRSTAPEAAPARPLDLGEFQTLKLENGLTVIVVENHQLPRVSYSLTVDVPAHLEGEYAGTSQLAGAMFRRATANKTKAELDEAIDQLGGTVGVSSTGGSARALSKHKEELMALFAESVLEARFAEEDLEIVRAEALAGLQQELVTPAAIADRVQNRIMYGDEHPYGELATEESLNRVGVEQVQNYYDSYFVPNRSYLVMVGDLTKVEARQLAERYFGNWESKEVSEPTVTAPRPPAGTRVSFIPRSGSVQSLIRIGHPVQLKPGEEDVVASNLLSGIFGGPFNGRLFMNLREGKGYTYGAYGRISPDKMVGTMTANADVRTEVTDSAVAEFMREMELIGRTPVSEVELSRGRNQLNGQLAQAMESPETIARFALNTVRYNLPEDYYATYLQKAEALDAADLLQVAQQYIKPDRAHIIVVGDRSVADKLARFASDGVVHMYDANGEPLPMEEPAPVGDISVEQIFNAYLEAVGGREELTKVQRFMATMSGNVQGMTMTQIMYQADNNKLATKIEAMGMTMMEQRYNDGKALMKQQGQNIPVDENALASMAEQAEMFPELNTAKYDEYTIVDGETIDGQATYAVKRETTGGSATSYYSRESGLKLRTTVNMQGQSQVIDFSDYKEVDGIQIPHTMNMTGMAPFPIKMTIDAVEINGTIDPSVFSVE